METLFNLSHAFERCHKSSGNRVWAEDRLRSDSKWGKVFLVGTPQEAIQRCMMQGRGKMYEIIESVTPCAFHLDIELSRGKEATKIDPAMSGNRLKLLKIPESKITEFEAEYMNVYRDSITDAEMLVGVAVCLKFILTFLNDSLGMTLTMEDLQVISGCRADKFSLHIVCRKVMFDSNVLSMQSYAFELCRHFRRELDKGYLKSMKLMNSSDPMRRFFVRCLMLHRPSHGWGGVVPLYDTPIDETIYTRNRQFRCVGSGKQGSPILRIVHKRPQFSSIDNIPYEKRLLSTDILCLEHHRWKDAVRSPTDFMNSLVGVAYRAAIEVPELVIHPSIWFKKPSFDSALQELHGMQYFDKKADCFLEAKRFFPEGFEDAKDSINNSNEAGERKTGERKKREVSRLAYKVLPENISKSRIELVDDTEMVFGEFPGMRELRECHSGDVVFHNTCEVTIVDSLRQPKGEPSARIIVNDDGCVGLYCFNCCTICWSIASYDPQKLTFEPKEILDSPYDKINENGRVDIDLDGSKKFVVIDAPPGTGKTELVGNFLKKHPELTVLAITFRVALASYMAWRLHLKCYNDGHWFPSNEETGKRMAICLDSLSKMTNHNYDVIILDEAGLTRRHITASTIASKLVAVYRSLERLLCNAKKVIICQHELTERDVSFYTSQVGVESIDRSQVTRRLFKKTIPIYPILVSKDCGVVVSSMVTFYLGGWNNEKKQLNIPFIVFCTSAKMCAAFTALLKSVATVEGRERIKGVWAHVQEEPWQRKFLDNPNMWSHEADVVLVTSVLQAGHSIDSHFKCAFWFLFRGILSHPDEVQFVQRLRTLGKARSAGMNISCAYIQDGLSHKKQASFMEILRKESIISNGFQQIHSYISALHTETLADVEALRCDTENRHFWLWQNLYSRLRVDFVTMQNVTIPHEVSWSPKRCMQWLTEYSNSLSRTAGKCLRRFFGDDLEHDIKSIEDVMKTMEDTEYHWLAKEQRTYIRDTHDTMEKLFGKNNLTVLTKILPDRDFEADRINSLCKKLKTLAAYLDYLADIYGPQEEATTRWSARLKHSTSRSDPECYLATLTVVLSAALFQNLCDYPFPLGRISLQLKPAEIKSMFERHIAGFKGVITIADLHEKVFKCASGKFYNSRSEKSKQYYSMTNLLSWVLARCRLRLKPVHFRKRKRDKEPQHQPPVPVIMPYSTAFLPVELNTPKAGHETPPTDPSLLDGDVEDIINNPALDGLYDDGPLCEEDLQNNGTVATDIETSGIKSNASQHILDYDHFHETLMALRCLYKTEDFSRWTSIDVLAPFLRNAQAAFDKLYAETAIC